MIDFNKFEKTTKKSHVPVPDQIAGLIEYAARQSGQEDTVRFMTKNRYAEEYPQLAEKLPNAIPRFYHKTGYETPPTEEYVICVSDYDADTIKYVMGIITARSDKDIEAYRKECGRQEQRRYETQIEPCEQD